MARTFAPQEVDPQAILSKTVAVIGYGNQGHAHALNLRDSGVEVVVGARAGKGLESALSAGFDALPIREAVERADVAMMCAPDVPMRHIYAEHVAPSLTAGKALLFCHGFNIRFGLIEPPPDVDVALVSPKGPGALLRREYEAGRGLAALVAVHRDATGGAWPIALAYAWGLGAVRTLVMQTTFAEETETDLFGEQAVLCGGIPGLIKAGFETLVEAGYQPEVAYFECLHEAKLITDLLYERGLAGMRKAISDTAEWGGFEAETRMVGPKTRASMRELLDAIRDGSFAKGLIEEDESGFPNLERHRREEASHPAEDVGLALRTSMWP